MNSPLSKPLYYLQKDSRMAARTGGVCSHHPDPVHVQLNISNRPLIEIRAMEMKREDRVILENVNLTINHGDFVAITGPNGGGKTTMLRIILGLLKPTSGTVRFLPERPVIGYLPQKNAIDSQFPLTVREVIESGLLGVRNISRAEISAKATDTLRRIEMTQFADRPIGKLSGGQLQRVLLGRAIISDPKLLVLDEPLSYVDKHFEAHIYRLIAEIAPHCTTLLVSHEMSTIATMANRHLLVDRTVEACHANRHLMAECIN